MSNIILIFIIYWVFSAVVKSKKEKDKQEQKAQRKGDNTCRKTSCAPVYPKNTVKKTEKKIEKSSPSEKHTGSNGQNSTMDYLAEKAEKEEARQEQQECADRLQQPVKINGKCIAARLIEGDIPPTGTQVLKCSYCGAENLIPKGSHEKYACYFCRENL